ncbi:MAG: mechanosensitive ion channel protein MscS [Micavibrio sp.]|nr:mechanosensitive ion channel protein MscS [Micavibrio sp.]|tara:strand:+ start:6078 stop:6959 length:882 start_codon:yes stop_codon:yes gene_type:complete
MELQLETIGGFVSMYAIKILIALAIFFIGKFLAKKVVRLCEKLMRKSKVDETLVSFAGNIIYGLALAFVAIAALSQLGINTTSLAAVIAAAGLAIGLALQSSLSNLASGVMLILFRPFKLGDYVEAAGTGGTVEEISIFTTKFKSPDNKTILVPNGEIIAGNIINYSAKPTRRVDLVFGVGYDDDLKTVKKILTKVVNDDERVLKEPEAVIAVHELGDNSVNLVCRPWVASADYWGVFWDLQEKVKLAFDKEGISIPYPQRDMHIVYDVNLDKSAKSNDDKKETKSKSKSKAA